MGLNGGPENQEVTFKGELHGVIPGASNRSELLKVFARAFVRLQCESRRLEAGRWGLRAGGRDRPGGAELGYWPLFSSRG